MKSRKTIIKNKEISKKWIKFWKEHDIYKAEDESNKEKTYILIEFPYPSGERLHVGHARSYSCLDSVARKRRMQGKNVLFPIGWDAFGLPAENYAIKTGIHPAITTKENIENAKNQAIDWGLSFDWQREINTTDSNYYKWTQWIFIKLFKNGLAYKQEIPVNWCPSCKINLANEEVVDGKCERCGTQTERRKQSQWLLRITIYADRLLEDLKEVDYRDDISAQQRNWIGRKEGINIKYDIEGMEGEQVEVFTTRPDTNFGATFIVLAPEHPLVDRILVSGKDVKRKSDIDDYVTAALKKSERERQMEEKKKTGVFTGRYAVNNLNGYKMPIWVSDFVLADFGTGAVVGVPGHDKRDFEFAREMGLPVVRVVTGSDGDTSDITRIEQVQEEEGTMMNSGFLNGMDVREATGKIMDFIEQEGWGKRTFTYHLRDWVFSRQHYWGEPIPMIYCPSCAARGESWFTHHPGEEKPFFWSNAADDTKLMTGWYPVPEEDLPVNLPDLDKFQPSGTGESPLSGIRSFVETECPECGRPARRETDTMPNWAGSSWYFVRYCDPTNDNSLADYEKLKYWLPVDWYNGGMEHTTLHLLYSRFWYKFLYDLGVVPTSEPYAKRTSHGVVLGPDGRKMSKSRGNVINPDLVVEKYGADTLRMYEMFIGPFEQMVAWSWEGVEGVHRFIKKIWKLTGEDGEKAAINTDRKESRRQLARLTRKVETDLEATKFNTAVAAMMEFVNWWGAHKQLMGKAEKEVFLRILAPMAPFTAEELFQQLRGDSVGYKSVHSQPWPIYDEKDLEEKEYTLVIQVDGKVRGRIVTSTDSKEENLTIALREENVKRFVREKFDVIFVPGKIINIINK